MRTKSNLLAIILLCGFIVSANAQQTEVKEEKEYNVEELFEKMKALEEEVEDLKEEIEESKKSCKKETVKEKGEETKEKKEKKGEGIMKKNFKIKDLGRNFLIIVLQISTHKLKAVKRM